MIPAEAQKVNIDGNFPESLRRGREWQRSGRIDRGRQARPGENIRKAACCVGSRDKRVAAQAKAN